jgi:hypothetical protein
MMRCPAMHVLFLAPDTHAYNHGFLRGLRSLGARVSGLGPTRADALTPGAREALDAYRAAENVLDVNDLIARARELAQDHPFTHVETIDEPLIEPAAYAPRDSAATRSR